MTLESGAQWSAGATQKCTAAIQIPELTQLHRKIGFHSVFYIQGRTDWKTLETSWSHFLLQAKKHIRFYKKILANKIFLFYF